MAFDLSIQQTNSSEVYDKARRNYHFSLRLKARKYLRILSEHSSIENNLLSQSTSIKSY